MIIYYNNINIDYMPNEKKSSPTKKNFPGGDYVDYEEVWILSPLRKAAIFIKRSYFVYLPDGRQEIFVFRDSLMPEYQLIDKDKNIGERNFFGLRTFRSGLKYMIFVVSLFIDLLFSLISAFSDYFFVFSFRFAFCTYRI